MRKGFYRLWDWFGIDRASFLTMPRVLMHEMPDEWQEKMATLCEEWDAHWKWPDDFPYPKVMAHRNGKFTSWPDWLLNYRRPDFNRAKIEALKTNNREKTND